MTTIEDKFNDAFGRWVQHCEGADVQVSSNPQTVIDCEAYKEIVTLGINAIPLIRKSYNAGTPESMMKSAIEVQKSVLVYGENARPVTRRTHDEYMPRNVTQVTALDIVKSHGIPQLVQDIVGKQFRIPAEIRGRVDEIEQYTKQWLDKYIPLMKH